MTETNYPRLNRRALGIDSAPVRILHLGLGAFHRAHQAWYTTHATDAGEWGIAAFSGRSPEVPELLEPQDGVFTLVTRGSQGDSFEHVTSITAAHAASDLDAFFAYATAASTAIVTITVTEAGYSLTPAGDPNLDDPALLHDVSELRRMTDAGDLSEATLSTTLGRLLLILEGRRLAGAPAIAIVPCDNIPSNGLVLSRALGQLAAMLSPALAAWLPFGATFVSTSVDRITPRSTSDLITTVARDTGWWDAAAVATEPFSDWTLSGAFPAGRPDWESAGARFVSDIEPFERRKLWLLNGAHTLLAASGRLRRHRTVAEAMADSECRADVNKWWDEAVRHLEPELDLDDYRAALTDRFLNPRIEHALEQIASDALTKVGVRIVPVARLERAAGRDADAAARTLAAWIATVTLNLPAKDPLASATLSRAGQDVSRSLLAEVAPDLAADSRFADRVHDLVDQFVADYL